jgi:hypothetical protein
MVENWLALERRRRRLDDNAPSGEEGDDSSTDGHLDAKSIRAAKSIRNAALEACRKRPGNEPGKPSSLRDGRRT